MSGFPHHYSCPQICSAFAIITSSFLSRSTCSICVNQILTHSFLFFNINADGKVGLPVRNDLHNKEPAFLSAVVTLSSPLPPLPFLPPPSIPSPPFVSLSSLLILQPFWISWEAKLKHTKTSLSQLPGTDSWMSWFRHPGKIQVVGRKAHTIEGTCWRSRKQNYRHIHRYEGKCFSKIVTNYKYFKAEKFTNIKKNPEENHTLSYIFGCILWLSFHTETSWQSFSIRQSHPIEI